jgi:hypothetical protein
LFSNLRILANHKIKFPLPSLQALIFTMLSPLLSYFSYRINNRTLGILDDLLPPSGSQFPLLVSPCPHCFTISYVSVSLSLERLCSLRGSSSAKELSMEHRAWPTVNVEYRYLKAIDCNPRRLRYLDCISVAIYGETYSVYYNTISVTLSQIYCLWKIKNRTRHSCYSLQTSYKLLFIEVSGFKL